MNKQTVKAVVRRLNEAADILSQPRAWVREEWVQGVKPEYREAFAQMQEKNCSAEEFVLRYGPACGTRFCLDGALQAACHKRRDLYLIAVEVLNRQVNEDYYGHEKGVPVEPADPVFIDWNDAEASDKRQVIRLLHRAAKRFANEHGVELEAVA